MDSPPSPYVRPTDEWVQVSPRSSLRKTAGPYQGLPPAARMAPEPGSTIMSWIGQPSHDGPRTDQSARSASLSRTNAPLGVPTRSRVRVVIGRSSAALGPVGAWCQCTGRAHACVPPILEGHVHPCSTRPDLGRHPATRRRRDPGAGGRVTAVVRPPSVESVAVGRAGERSDVGRRPDGDDPPRGLARGRERRASVRGGPALGRGPGAGVVGPAGRPARCSRRRRGRARRSAGHRRRAR